MKVKEKGRVLFSRQHYAETYDDLYRFVSYFFQISAVRSLPSSKTVLEIGIGNQLVTSYLRNCRFDILTCDINRELRPDCMADIRRLPFEANSFDVVVACQVLEHLPFQDFPQTLLELGRIAKKYVIISLPYITVNVIGYIEWLPKVKPIFFCFRLFEFLHLKRRYSKGHCWEMGERNYPRKRIKKIIQETGFVILREFTPFINAYHYFFVLQRAEMGECPAESAEYRLPTDGQFWQFEGHL